MDIIKRTHFAQSYLRDNIVINLFSRNWKLILADKDYFVCSLQLDLNEKETYFVFQFDKEDNLLKLGKGKMDGDKISLEEIKFEWKQE